MASSAGRSQSWLWMLLLLAVLLVRPAAAFGAGNIASISKIEGVNWRHGDIEDMLKTVAFIKGHKWTSMMVKRVYFGNWLRDYSQAMDVGSLKSVQAESVRVLVWVLAFVSFGYATGEFEVTADRLGVYRPEEHIDNPKDYADNKDAREFHPKLRPPVLQVELEIDPRTGMKNYIANENLDIATSIGYVKYSLSRSIHYGRTYTHGHGSRGRDEDLYEALRCLGQALHCMEDFGAHSNYIELSLRELGHRNVFPHTGVSTEMNIQGHRAYPLVTGTFGMVDFIHSVLGEATDHFTQSEVSEVDNLNSTLQKAQATGGGGGGGMSRGFDDDYGDESSRGFGGGSGSQLSSVVSLLGQLPGSGGLAREAEELQAQSMEQERLNEQMSRAGPGQGPPSFQGPPGAAGGPPGPGVPGMPNIDPVATARKIYPILEFRDKIAKAIQATIEKIPGLEALVEKITETITLFIFSLLAPFVRPLIDAVSKSMKTGSAGVVEASGKHQYEPWTDPHCTDPTHSLLSKDHFSNVLNEPAGKVASEILKYTAPRVLYAWEHPDVPVDEVLNDVTRAFHHPILRDRRCELHNKMFEIVEHWARTTRHPVDQILSADSVRAGHNHLDTQQQNQAHGHSHGGGSGGGLGMFGGGTGPGGFGIPSTNQLTNLFQSAASSTFGFGGKQSGGRRDIGDEFEAEAAQVGQQYARTETGFDNTRPPPGADYSGPRIEPQPPFAHDGRYPSPAPPQQEFYGYGRPPAPGEYQGGYQGQMPQPYGGYNDGGYQGGGYQGGPPIGGYGGPGFNQGPPPPGPYGGGGYNEGPPPPGYGGGYPGQQQGYGGGGYY